MLSSKLIAAKSTHKDALEWFPYNGLCAGRSPHGTGDRELSSSWWDSFTHWWRGPGDLDPYPPGYKWDEYLPRMDTTTSKVPFHTTTSKAPFHTPGTRNWGMGFKCRQTKAALFPACAHARAHASPIYTTSNWQGSE
jgi:hypothetical protein